MFIAALAVCLISTPAEASVIYDETRDVDVKCVCSGAQVRSKQQLSEANMSILLSMGLSGHKLKMREFTARVHEFMRAQVRELDSWTPWNHYPIETCVLCNVASVPMRSMFAKGDRQSRCTSCICLHTSYRCMCLCMWLPFRSRLFWIT